MSSPARPPGGLALLGLCTLTMIAFAANSLLCRAALLDGRMGPFAFTALRLSAGALVLLALSRPAKRKTPSPEAAVVPARRALIAPLSLLVYALGFSFAYTRLDAGTGALILFAAVQLTMLGRAWSEGERPTLRTGVGTFCSIGGLVLLLWPGLDTPDLLGALLMALAGSAWGTYSLVGRASAAPLDATCRNFVRTAPVALLAWGLVLALGEQASLRGVQPWLVGESVHDWDHSNVLAALASGGLASGLGYALWYRVLPHLGTLRASVAQLSVPILAAAGGALILGEVLGLRWMLACILTLVGIALVSTKPAPRARA